MEETEAVRDEVPQAGANSSAQLQPRVRAIQREYDRATQAWQKRVLQVVMMAMDEVYAQIPHEETEAVPYSITRINESETMEFVPTAIRTDGKVDLAAVYRGDFDALLDAVIEMAERTLPQLMQMYFEVVDQVTQRTGQQFESQGDLSEAIIRAIEALPLEFDEHGIVVNFQFATHPAAAERMRAALDGMSSDPASRLHSVIERKRREYYASRRTRRLPRIGN